MAHLPRLHGDETSACNGIAGAHFARWNEYANVNSTPTSDGLSFVAGNGSGLSNSLHPRISPGSRKTKEAFTSSKTLPLTVIVDRDGKIHGIIEGVIYADEFAERVKPLLSRTIPKRHSNRKF